MNFRKHFERALLCGALLLLSTSAASAAIISETEASNASGANDTSATAQALTAASFTPNADPNVFGTDPTATINGAIGAAGDIDFFSFMAMQGDSAYFDIDLTPNNGPDTFLSLFDSTGTLLAGGDDSTPADPGSETDVDAFLGTYFFNANGTYFIAVSQSGNSPNAFNDMNATQSGLTRPDGSPNGGFAVTGVAADENFTDNTSGAPTGAYQLNVTIVPAPEPGTMTLMAIGLAGLGAANRKRKKATREEVSETAIA